MANFANLSRPVLSKPVHFRNFEWQIKIFPFTRPGKSIKSLAFYVLCKDPSGSESWSCNASLNLMVKSYQVSSDNVRKISQLFCQQQAECGFTYYSRWNEICLNERFVKDGAVKFKAVVEVFENGVTSRFPDDVGDDLLKWREKKLKLVHKTCAGLNPKWTEYQEWIAELVIKICLVSSRAASEDTKAYYTLCN